MFKNLTTYRMPKRWNMNEAALAAALSSQHFTHCGQLDRQTAGWVPVRPNSDQLVHVVNRQYLLKLKFEKKVLPPGTVAEKVKERAAEIEKQQGFIPGRKQLKEVKEQVEDELLARAFTDSKEMYVWIDPVNGWLMCDTSTPARVEEALKFLMKGIPKFPVETLRTQRSPLSAMTDWLASDEAPAGFTVDQEAELRASGDSKATVRFLRHTLDPADVRRHIESGKQCTRLALTWNDRISFVLTENLSIKSIKLLDVLKTENEGNDRNDDERFDGEFMLFSGEVTKLLPDLVNGLGGEQEMEAAA